MAGIGTFYVPEELGGMTLGDLVRKRGGGRADVLGNYLGVNPNQTLTAGQKFTIGDIPGVDPSGSAELQFIQNQFTPSSVYQQNQQKAFQDEQRARIDQFTGKLDEVPTQLEAVRQALGLPGAYETYGKAGEAARNIGYLIEDIPQAAQQALSGQGVSAGQIKGRSAQEVKDLQPSLTAASRALESSGSTLSNLLGQYQTETSNIFTPLQIESGLLGDSIAQEFGLFKTNIQADLDRELAQLSSQTQLDINQINNAARLAEIEQASEQGEFRDLGDRIALINPFNGKEIKSFSKGLAPKRETVPVDLESSYNKALSVYVPTSAGRPSAYVAP